MRQEFLDRLRILLRERSAGSWKDGWVYGRLKQDFDLQPDELNEMAAALRFRYGWNSSVKDILENQWQEDEVRWMRQERETTKNKVSQQLEKLNISGEIARLLHELETLDIPREKITDLERVLIKLIFRMRVDEQLWMLEAILNRYKI